MADFSKVVFGSWEPKGTTLVEASAGTGKTYSIQSAYLRLVLEGYPVTGILVVTFTDAATAELRERLRGVLEECRSVLEKHRAELEECRTDFEVPQEEERAWKALLGARLKGTEVPELRMRAGAALALGLLFQGSAVPALAVAGIILYYVGQAVFSIQGAAMINFSQHARGTGRFWRVFVPLLLISTTLLMVVGIFDQIVNVRGLRKPPEPKEEY